MTVAPPTGWKQHFGADVMLFEAPGGVGRIRVHMRAPLEPLSAVIARVVAGEVDRWIVDETSAVVTSEGEYGAFSRVSTRANSVGSVRFVGTIFADDTCVTLEGRATRASAESMIESVTRELLLRFTLALGVRRRRFVYAPPAGWDAVPHGLVTSWYPAGFPDDRAQLVVYPAEPTYSDGRLELEQLLTSERDRGAEVQGEICADVIEATGGLVGQSWAFVLRGPEPGVLVRRELVSFARAPYRYALKLDSAGGEPQEHHRATMLAVAASVTAIPTPGQQRIGAPHARGGISAVQHWAE